MKRIPAEQLLLDRELSSFTLASTLGAMSEASILWLLQNGKIHSVSKGENIFSQGQPGNSFHVILSGQISYYRYHNGRYSYIRDFNCGEQIGFMSLIALHDRVGRAEAAGQDTITLEIDSTVFREFHEKHSMEFGILMMNLAREMARTCRSLGNLMVEKDYARDTE